VTIKMPPRSRKKVLLPPGKGARADRKAPKDRRNKKLEIRKKEKSKFTADQWAVPAPSHLVAQLEKPKHKSRYHSYFEFAENTNKKEKKLEFQVCESLPANYLESKSFHPRLQTMQILHLALDLFPSATLS
jgi:hypothetical protein